MRPSRILFAAFACALAGGSWSPLDAQTFAHVPRLAFTKPFGGANPLPQVLNIVSTGANFRFSASAVTATGGSWLQLSPQGTGCCLTPEAITVTVNPSVALAAGSYSGQITFTSYPTPSASMTVAVVLTVVAPGTPLFDNLPGQLSFSARPGGNPPAQEVQVRNGGAGALAWTLTKSTADGHNWLTVSAATGTAPSSVTIGILHSALPGGGLVAGAFIGQLVFTSGGRSVTVPVTVEVADNVLSQINPLQFTARFGGANPLPQILAVAASDATTMRFTVESATGKGGNWLQISPHGLGCCLSPQAISVDIDAAGLAAGSYTGQITVTEYPSRNQVMNVPVTLTVAPAAGTFFGDVGGQMSFFMGVGGAPPPQTIRIQNGGSGTLNWTLAQSTADGGNWLQVSQTSGTAPLTEVTITVVPNALPGAGLVPGTFVGQLVFDTPGSSVTVPVSLVVGSNIFLQASPISFSKPFGGADPLPQILTVGTTSSAVRFTAVAATGEGGNWLQISPQGLGCCISPESITVSPNAAALSPGVYTAQVTFYEYPSMNMAMTVPVTLTVAQGIPFFDNMAGQLSFFMETGHTPPAQSIQVRNGAPGTLNWSLNITTADGGNWLASSALSGSTPATITIRVLPAQLPGAGLIAGTFTGTLSFTGPGASISIPVSVVVGTNVFRQVNPIGFTKVFGAPNPLPQIVTVAQTGSSVLRFTAVAATAKGGNWLQISPKGLGCCLTPDAVSVSINAAALPVGTYTGQVTFIEYPQGSMSMTVPVTLSVTGVQRAFFDTLPGQLSFSMKTGDTPPQQIVHIRDGGAPTTNWTLGKSTSDGGAWLTASPASGTAPSDISVGVARQALPGAGLLPGTFTGQIILRAPGTFVTIPVSVVVGDNVFRQVNPIDFTKKFGAPGPLPQVLTIATTGTTALRFSASATTANGGNWLQISPQGLGCCVTPEAITVRVNAPSLAAGTYTGQITITEYPGNDKSLTIPVTLTVAPATSAFFADMVGEASFSMVTGGTPAGRAVVVRNGGTGALTWTLTRTTADGHNWLTVSALSGTGTASVKVTIARALLPGSGQIAGTFVGHLLFRTAGSSMSVPVTVTVGPAGFRQLGGLAFTAKAGSSDPLPKVLNVASNGTALRFTASAANAKGGNWLQISPQGLGCCITPSATTARAHIAGLAPGVYLGEILLVQYPGNDASMTVPVTLTISGSSLVDPGPDVEESQ